MLSALVFVILFFLLPSAQYTEFDYLHSASFFCRSIHKCPRVEKIVGWPSLSLQGSGPRQGRPCLRSDKMGIRRKSSSRRRVAVPRNHAHTTWYLSMTLQKLRKTIWSLGDLQDFVWYCKFLPCRIWLVLAVQLFWTLLNIWFIAHMFFIRGNICKLLFSVSVKFWTNFRFVRPYHISWVSPAQPAAHISFQDNIQDSMSTPDLI